MVHQWHGGGGGGVDQTCPTWGHTSNTIQNWSTHGAPV